MAPTSIFLGTTIFVTQLLILTKSQTAPNYNNACQSINTCSDCIGRGCVWCTNHNLEAKHLFVSGKRIPRCDTFENHKKRGDGYCGTDTFLEVPLSQTQLDVNKKVNQNQKVHLSPQQARAKLAVGQSVTFEVTYLEDADKRLDLYYILDLSHTMKDDKDTVAAESQRLAAELRRLTKDVRFGFGSFVDKPVTPYCSYSQITQTHSDYIKPYGFKNHLSLTHDINEFRRIVAASQISANIDAAEGGFDALMQAIVCADIGWREDGTHKLIVIASDGPFHIAGDGRLGGIVIPNDMECHLDSKGDYTHSTLLDYPSVGQLNAVVRRNRTYIIFAVTDDYFELYSQLSKRIDKSTAGKLRSNSDNVVELVRNQYNNIKGNVQLIYAENGPNKLSNYVDIRYKVKCSNGAWIDSDTCKNVGPGEQVKFQVTLTLTQCPQLDRNGEMHFTTFELKGREQLNVKVELNCDCNCTTKEQPVDYDVNVLGSICSGHAKRLQCGKCVCDEEHSGANCECSKVGGGFQNRTNCRLGQDSKDCSGRGTCVCGQCDCSKSSGWGGQFCECDQSKCRLNPSNEFERECANGNGRCVCGKCNCNEDRGGDKCQCPRDKKTCKEPGRETMCGENGECTCSKRDNAFDTSTDWEWKCTKCNAGFSGKFCHVCRGGSDSCPQKEKSQTQCQDPRLQQCVQCHMNNHLNNSWTKDVCAENCGRGNQSPSDQSNTIDKFDVTLVPYIGEYDTAVNIMCDVTYNDTCVVAIFYQYQTTDEQLALTVTLGTTLICQPPINVLPYILYAAGGVIFIGLLTLLLWKLFTSAHDRREFHRFEKERAVAKWAKGENPLYSTPMSTFQNPAYRN